MAHATQTLSQQVAPAPAPALAPPQVSIDDLFDRSAKDLSGGGQPLSPSWIEGEHRVVIHTVEGQVKRGLIRDVDLFDPHIPLEQQTGYAPERIAINRVKAIFFMLPQGARPPPVSGKKIRVTFSDGRQVAGFSDDYANNDPGFFVIPADNRTNTDRIFIYRGSVQAIVEG
ncbi:MAG: hypothetical protein IRZ16_21655 [Myxococcaceae bacterium]|nr:hypothetical protein [Myxococcaceae bacterium]